MTVLRYNIAKLRLDLFTKGVCLMTTKRVWRWTIVLVWLVLTIFLSQQTGSQSAKISGWLTQRCRSVLDVFGVHVGYSALHAFLRKMAHVMVHLILAWLAYRAICTTGLSVKADILLCLVLCGIVAIIDESLQTNVIGRSAAVFDAILNLFGIEGGLICGILSTNSREYATPL